MATADLSLLESTFSPLIISAEDALRTSMRKYLSQFQDVIVELTSYGDFLRALQMGEDMITLGMVISGVLILEKVVFNPFSQTLAVLRDSSIDPVLSSVLRPFAAVSR